MAEGLTSAKGQDFKELSLMSSEKTEAMSASADAMAASAGAIGQRLGRVAMDEGAHAADKPGEEIPNPALWAWNMMAQAGTDEETIFAEIDLAEVAQARDRVPSLSHDREFTGP